MKRLLLSLLFSAPLLAMPYPAAKRTLEEAQARVDACAQRLQNLRKEIDGADQETRSISSSPEYASAIRASRGKARGLMPQYEQAVEESKAADTGLQEAVSKVGRYHVVNSDGNGRYSCEEQPKAQLEPIRTSQPARTSTVSSTSSYPASSYSTASVGSTYSTGRGFVGRRGVVGGRSYVTGRGTIGRGIGGRGR